MFSPQTHTRQLYEAMDMLISLTVAIISPYQKYPICALTSNFYLLKRISSLLEHEQDVDFFVSFAYCYVHDMQTRALPARVLNQYLFNKKKKKMEKTTQVNKTLLENLEKTIRSPNKYPFGFSDDSGAVLDTKCIWWGKKTKM